jgi:hypothetical protein
MSLGLWTSRANPMAPFCFQLQRHCRVSWGSWTLRAGLMALSRWQTSLVNDPGQPLHPPACNSYITCTTMHKSLLHLQNYDLTLKKRLLVSCKFPPLV